MNAPTRDLQSAESLPSIPGYRLIERVASGGMGTVYKAQAGLLTKPQAIKLLHARYSGDPSYRKRFLVEANLIASFSHPGLLKVHHAGEADGILYIATEFCSRGTLRSAHPFPMEVERALRCIREIAIPLGVLHLGHVVHRDLKPENILVDDQGHLLIADFGIAKALVADPSTMTQMGNVCGTLDYMSPEQLAGASDLDARSDIFALGAMLHEMIDGRPPYAAVTPYDMALAHSQPPPLLPPHAEIVQSLVSQMLRRDPSARPANCDQLVVEIDRVLELMARGVQRATQVVGAPASAEGYATGVYVQPSTPVNTGGIGRAGQSSEVRATVPMVGLASPAVDGNGATGQYSGSNSGALASRPDPDSRASVGASPTSEADARSAAGVVWRQKSGGGAGVRWRRAVLRWGALGVLLVGSILGWQQLRTVEAPPTDEPARNTEASGASTPVDEGKGTSVVAKIAETTLIAAIQHGDSESYRRSIESVQNGDMPAQRVRDRVVAVITRLEREFGAAPWTGAKLEAIEQRMIGEAREFLAASKVGLPFPPGENAVDVLRVLMSLQPGQREARGMYDRIIADYSAALKAAREGGNTSAAERVSAYLEYASNPKLN